MILESKEARNSSTEKEYLQQAQTKVWPSICRTDYPKQGWIRATTLLGLPTAKQCIMTGTRVHISGKLKQIFKFKLFCDTIIQHRSDRSECHKIEIALSISL